ncbi:MAG: FAD-dependent monooxygenase [Thermomicrobiales bacterium]|nr:FAD-dependent monooxygenase [Thermomicrobiales bacterium]
MTPAASSSFDVIVLGGGIAGATLGGVLARPGLGVLVVEKEARFRDRVRGEGTWPWGVAEAHALRLHELLCAASTVPLAAVHRYQDQVHVETMIDMTADGSPPGLAFFHPQFQEAAFTWAADQGATLLRPARTVAFASNGRPALTIATQDGEVTCTARLVVGADGKLSKVRQWTGGESLADPEHHRMGGVLVAGAVIDRAHDNVAWVEGEAVNWFPAGPEMTRLYVEMTAARLRETGIDRSFAALIAFAAPLMPEGALEHATQAGPIGFFPTNDIWASRIAGNHVALIGDAAGAPDPSQGHGTPMIFRDVRALSELLLSETNWESAIRAYARERARAFAVIREVDRWHNAFFEMTQDALRLQEGHERAKAYDPELGGFSALALRGPDGLVADEAARRHYFGEDIG